jgi:copper chaperone CopZ
MQTTTLKISGMSCGHCVGSVSHALKSVAGVENADVKIGSATVYFDPAKTTVEQLTDAVEDQGYEVAEVA